MLRPSGKAASALRKSPVSRGAERTRLGNREISIWISHVHEDVETESEISFAIVNSIIKKQLEKQMDALTD